MFFHHPKTAAIATLGCKVNSYESDQMAQKLREAGFILVDFSSRADVYLINTCCVTMLAAKKSRQMIHRARELNPNALVAALGCSVDRDDSLIKEGAIDLAVSNQEKPHLLEKLLPLLKAKESPATKASDAAETTHPLERPEPPFEAAFEDFESAKERTRAYLKIQDGCRQFCSYCIIPYVRGPLQSRPMGECLKEAKELVAKGYKEIVLTGIHVSSYRSEGTLTELLQGLNEIPGLERIRLSSLEPRLITASLIETWQTLPKLCPHFHLSLQSGCDKTLQEMNRHYTSAQYRESVRLLRSAFPNVALTADIIVGFPGESEEDHQASLAFVESMQFAEAHVFRYSKMQGTEAARRSDQIAPEIKKQRSKEMLLVTQKSSLRFMKAQIGLLQPVLIEERDPQSGMYLGHTTNYMKVAIDGISMNGKGPDESLIGSIKPVMLTAFTEHDTANHRASRLNQILKGELR